MFELFINLPDNHSIIGRFHSEEECHRKADELSLSNYCINLYIYENFSQTLYDTWCYTVINQNQNL